MNGREHFACDFRFARLKHLVEPPELGLELHAVEHAPLPHLEDVAQLLQIPVDRLLEKLKKHPDTAPRDSRADDIRTSTAKAAAAAAATLQTLSKRTHSCKFSENTKKKQAHWNSQHPRRTSAAEVTRQHQKAAEGQHVSISISSRQTPCVARIIYALGPAVRGTVRKTASLHTVHDTR